MRNCKLLFVFANSLKMQKPGTLMNIVKNIPSSSLAEYMVKGGVEEGSDDTFLLYLFMYICLYEPM